MGVEAVSAYAAAAHEGGADVDVCLTVCSCDGSVGGVERAADSDGLSVMPAYEAAAILSALGGEQATRVDAVRDGQRAGWQSHEAAVGAVALCAAMDDGADLAVRDSRYTVTGGHQSGSKLLIGIDVASHLQVLDGSSIRVAERCTIVLAKWCRGSANVDGQRLAVAKEGALESLVGTDTRHGRDGHVGSQLHVLAVEVGASVDQRSEEVPFVGIADDVGLFLCAFALNGIEDLEVEGLRAKVTVRAANDECVLARRSDANG